MRLFHTCASVTVFLGLPANLLVLVYLLRGRLLINPYIKSLHLWIVVTDILIAVSLAPFPIEQLGGVQLYTPQHHLLCELIQFSGDLWIRLSYYLICVISVVRYLIIRRVKSSCSQVRVPLNTILCAGACLLALQSLVPVLLRLLLSGVGCAVQDIWTVTFPNPHVRKVWTILTILVETVVAMSVILVFNTLSIYYLFRDEGRRLSSTEKLAIKWYNTTILHRNSTFSQPSSIKVKTFAAKLRAATITLMMSAVFFALHIAGVLNTLCKALEVDIGINGDLANSLSFLCPPVNCVVYGLRFKGFWEFWGGVWRRVCERGGELEPSEEEEEEEGLVIMSTRDTHL